MKTETIALLIQYFNITAATVMGFFAICGLFAAFFKKSNFNIFRGRTFIQAFCVAALLALALEATVFNFQYYIKYISDGEFHTTGVSPSDSTVILTTDSTIEAHIKIERKNDTTLIANGITFKNLNRRVTSIYIEPVFGTAEYLQLLTQTTDANGPTGGAEMLYSGFPRDNYITLLLCGKLSELTIVSPGEELLSKITGITINKPVPFYISGLRFFAVSCLLFLLILFVRKELRTQVTQFLLEYRFDPANRVQKQAYAALVVLLLIYSFICAFTSTNKFWQEEYITDWQYNIFLVDALLDGRTYLDAGSPEKLLLAERPYDLKWLEKNGFQRDVDWFADWAWYDGKFYSYFGIVPAVILFVPYKLITGNYLPNYAGIFVFCAIAVVLMAMLWRFCVKRYMPDMRFAFYLLGFLALFFASGLFVPLRFTRFYSIVSSAGFMFAIAGILLLLKSVARGRANYLKLFFACLCLALTVGCRPNLIFVSLIVPVILWRHRSLKLAAFVLLPYVLVAVPLCWYNYIRFGSITDFGVNYNMTNLNIAAYNLLPTIGKVINTFVASVSYLFSVNRFTYAFPYIECTTQMDKFSLGLNRFHDKGCGIINFPIVFCLFFYFRALFTGVWAKTFFLSSAFLAIAAITIAVNSWMIGHSGRYTIDFAFFMIFPAILCAYHWCSGGSAQVVCDTRLRGRLKVAYALLAASVFVGLCLFATTVTNDITPGNPVLYRYLQTSLGVIGSV